MTLAGVVWRSDSQRALFLQETDTKLGKGEQMEPWEKRRDGKKPQFARAKHLKLDAQCPVSCTAASYSPDGKTIWTAFSDVKNFQVCGVTEDVQGGAKSRVVYQSAGSQIHHLAPSPDGKFLSWVETHPRRAPLKDYRGPDAVIVDVKSGMVIRRIGLSKDIPSWLDTPAPVWSADSAAICYGDVAVVNRVWRREVRLARLADKTSSLLVRDSIAIGAVDGGIILNRGPNCVPSRQHASSYAPMPDMRPTTNDVIFRSLTADGESITLLRNAYAQHVRKGRIVYAQRNDDDILIMRATLKRPGKGKPAADKPAPKGTDAKKKTPHRPACPA
jgi:hypothetical protein